MLLLSPPEPEEQGASLARLNTYHDEMMHCLRTIKSTFNPRGRLSDKELWTWIPNKQRNLGTLVAGYEESMRVMFNWKDRDVPDWENLEVWIENANQLHRLRMDYCGRVASISGQDLDDGSTLTKLRNDFIDSPAHSMVARTYGPNWEAGLDGILRSYGASSMSLSKLIPLDRCHELAHRRAAEVLRRWERLQDREEHGQLAGFVDRWNRLDIGTRSSWLRDQANVWEVPHADIQAWAECASPNSKHFLSSLLNVEDLALENQLPDFLLSRTHQHPQMLREVDARSIPFGLYTEALPALRCEGRMIFSNTTLDGKSYDITIAAADQNNWSALDPCNGLLSLQAQLLIYDFCLQCTADSLPTPSQPPVEDTVAGTGSTLLDRCARLDYVNPDTIDLKHIQGLLRTSLDEAHDDLWQLRVDYDFWVQRIRETKAQDCTARLLRTVFHRIDLFAALTDLADEALAVYGSNDVSSRLDGAGASDAIIHLEVALLSAQNAILQNLSSTRRLHLTPGTPLEKLVDVLIKDSPLARVMDLGRLLRVIDRQIRQLTQSSATPVLPSTLIQAINDLAVLAFSLNQVCNHYFFKTTVGPDHFKRFDDLDKLWQARAQPWSDLIVLLIESIDDETRRKLDVLWTRETMSTTERHYQFWSTIDNRIEAIATTHPEFNNIIQILRRAKPTQPDIRLPEKELTPSAWLPLTGPSQTATRKGKKRAQSIIAEPVTIPPPSEPDPQPVDPRPVIPVPMGTKRAWNFWNDLLHNGPTTRKEFHWHDLITAMASIGYSHEATTGSVYRFEYMYKPAERGALAINFHRPHGNVLNARQARAQWRERILRRVRLELIED